MDTRTLQDVAARLAAFGAQPAVLALGKDDLATTTFADLAAQVDRLAAGLQRAGLAPGERVALMAETRLEWLVTALATVRAGGVVVPVDAQLTADTLRAVVTDADPKFLFTTVELAAKAGGVLPQAAYLVGLFDAPESDDRHWLRFVGEVQDFPQVAAEAPAALFYTSGTTGTPKGVPLTQANLAFQMNAVRATGVLGSSDRMLLPLPLHHVYPLVIGFFAPMALGIPVVLPHSLTGPELLRAIRQGGVTVIIGVPRLYRAIFDGILTKVNGQGRLTRGVFHGLLRLSSAITRRTGRHPGRVLFRSLHQRFGPALRLLACGGSPLDPDLAWSLEGLGWPVAIGYGLTETSPLLAMRLPPQGAGGLDTVGLAVPGVELRLAATDLPGVGGAEPGPQADPTSGEIQARGPGIFAGYRGLPDKTAEAFTPDGWFRTGDLGAFDAQGRLRVLGRASTLIVTEGGEKVQPDEVEDTLARRPFIREIAVLQADRRLTAVVLPDLEALARAGQSDVASAVRQAVVDGSRELPSYARPVDVVLTRTPFERTRLGKLRRHLLAERLKAARSEGAPSTASLAPMAVEAMTAEDQALLAAPAAAATWAVLAARWPDKALSPDTSPQLDLHVDSLEWMTLGLEIREKAGIELSAEAVGRVATVRDLLREAMAAAQDGGADAASRADPLSQPEEYLGTEQRRWLAPLSAWEQRLARLSFGVVLLLLRLLFRVRVRGREHVPPDPVVFAPNHVSYLDPFVVIQALGLPRVLTVAMAAWTGAAFVNAFTRFFARLGQALPIDPMRGAAEGLAFGSAVLRSGRSLLWFPEGARSLDGQLAPFRPGLGLILASTGSRVVPVHIAGTYAAWPPQQRWPKAGHITVTFGPPATPAELAAEGQGATPQERIMDGLRRRVERLGRN